tara:strand:+ start:758 stop:1144 length:387 start_codon:yes stop_codon:yes gene_type:complete
MSGNLYVIDVGNVALLNWKILTIKKFFILTSLASYLCETSAECNDYQNRKAIVSDCITLSVNNLKDLKWMPETCAYKLLDEGKKLPYWHPLLIGNNDEIVKSGNSVKNRVTSETKIKVKHLPNYIFNW